MIKEDYQTLLNQHDWYYARASGDTYAQGKRQRDYLIQLANTCPAYMKMFLAAKAGKAGA